MDVQLLILLAGFRPKHRHHRREPAADVDVVIDEVIVYVDEENNVPYSTSISVYQYETVIPAAPSTTFAPSTTSPAAVPPASTTPTTLVTSTSTSAPASPPPSVAPAPPAAPSPAPSPAAPVQNNVPAAPASSPAAAPVPAPSTPAPPSSPPAQGSDFSLGISYSPYSAPNTCKSDATQAEELAAISNYNVIRLYDSNCNSVANVIAATKGKNVQIFAGFPDLTDFQTEITDLQTQVGGDWNLIHSVAVGNEIVGGNPSQALANQVAAAVATAKNGLQNVGYNGPVVAVDDMVTMQDYPQLCAASDYCAINCHTFWDGNATPRDAGEFVLGWVQKISDSQGGKRTIVTESGWPTQGTPYINSIPSEQNMQTTIASLKATFSNNLILYSAYDTTWQSGTDQQYWGIVS